MEAIYAITLLLAVFAFGEIVAQKTKALLSTTLVIAIVFMILFWCGMTPEIFEISAVNSIGMILVGFLITSLGTMMDFPELKRQWKTVIISLMGVLFGVSLIILVGQFIIGREMAVAGAPIFAGANTATFIMTKALGEKGLDSLSTFCILMLVTQSFIGIPISSFLLRKEAKKFLTNEQNVLLYAGTVDSANVTEDKPRKLLQLPATWNKPSIILTKLALVASLSFFVAGLTNGKLHYFVLTLLMGVLFTELGFLEKNVLDKTNSSGFIIFATTIVIFSNLAKATPEMLLSMIGPLLISLIIGTIGVIISGIITGKVLKVSPYLTITLGLTCTFGFPTTMLMSKEVATAIGTNDKEKEAITNYLMPKLITAGFVTVTIASVVIAGVVVTML